MPTLKRWAAVAVTLALAGPVDAKQIINPTLSPPSPPSSSFGASSGTNNSPAPAATVPDVMVDVPQLYFVGGGPVDTSNRAAPGFAANVPQLARRTAPQLRPQSLPTLQPPTSAGDGVTSAYVFNVPVRIESAPPLAGRPFVVECTVIHAGVLSPNRSATQTIGPTGFNGTVQVRVRGSINLADVRHWECRLRFFEVTNAAGAVVFWRPENNAEATRTYPVLTGQQIEVSNVYAAVDFPRAP